MSRRRQRAAKSSTRPGATSTWRTASEQDALRQRLAPKQAALEGFFAAHQDIVRA
jgi:hypothetical protein